MQYINVVLAAQLIILDVEDCRCESSSCKYAAASHCS